MMTRVFNGCALISRRLRSPRISIRFEIGRVRQYELPYLRAFNFVIEKALAGGASRSLRLDTQGKALGMALLELRLPAPESLASGNTTETT